MGPIMTPTSLGCHQRARKSCCVSVKCFVLPSFLTVSSSSSTSSVQGDQPLIWHSNLDLSLKITRCNKEHLSACGEPPRKWTPALTIKLLLPLARTKSKFYKCKLLILCISLMLSWSALFPPPFPHDSKSCFGNETSRRNSENNLKRNVWHHEG